MTNQHPITPPPELVQQWGHNANLSGVPYDDETGHWAYEQHIAARAALAQPEPQGPTDEELVELFNENDWNYISPETFIDVARSVLDYWGRPASQPNPVGPTDEELVELFNENDWNYISPETFLDIARSVLELR